MVEKNGREASDILVDSEHFDETKIDGILVGKALETSDEYLTAKSLGKQFASHYDILLSDTYIIGTITLKGFKRYWNMMLKDPTKMVIFNCYGNPHQIWISWLASEYIDNGTWQLLNYHPIPYFVIMGCNNGRRFSVDNPNSARQILRSKFASTIKAVVAADGTVTFHRSYDGELEVTFIVITSDDGWFSGGDEMTQSEIESSTDPLLSWVRQFYHEHIRKIEIDCKHYSVLGQQALEYCIYYQNESGDITYDVVSRRLSGPQLYME